jgi:hydrogenase maturation protein HypF
VRLAASVEGVAQGVGFRPLVVRIALRVGIAGEVRNTGDGATIEAEGEQDSVETFWRALTEALPRGVRLGTTKVRAMTGVSEFVIATSVARDEKALRLPPDLAPCAECLAEISTATERRFRYPFVSCTRCGPRWSIALAQPWDRDRTTMRPFTMCAECESEYRNVDDRRAHAQTLACPRCGPTLWLDHANGQRIATGESALREVTRALGEDKVVAIKGVGGWQLLAAATREAAVALLRTRKGRETKPFAVLFKDLEQVGVYCAPDTLDRLALTSPATPIVLTRARGSLAPSVAPGSRLTGAMLPSSPLYAIIADEYGSPLVCTSGNLADEPLCVSDDDARVRLAPIADLLLGHDRAIARALDDSVLRTSTTGAIVLRRARGMAPRTLARREEGPVVLALGAHLKATVTLALRDEYVVSQHVGDLDSPAAIDRHAATARELLQWTGARPDVIACDLHEDYASTRLAESLARELGVPLVRVQHHAAHVAAVAAEHGITHEILGFAWDGTGLGDDRALWGGETLSLDGAHCRRVAHVREFLLPGGEAAIREPRRAALGLLLATGVPFDTIARWFTAGERSLLTEAARKGVNAPRTTSVGRLFDALGAMMGLVGRARYESEAAMRVEEAAHGISYDEAEPYPCLIAVDCAPWVIETAPLVRAVHDDILAKRPIAHVSARFHATLAEVVANVTARSGAREVALGGGCFQNVRLTEHTRDRLRARGVVVWTPLELPPGDGGISVGQALLGARRWLRDVSGRSG